jgi:hypothetical protein
MLKKACARACLSDAEDEKERTNEVEAEGIHYDSLDNLV